jgi:predicted DNA-binding protein (MmcQ/YjbR family)
MDIERIRKFCLSLPHATEDIQWENDLLFRIAGKMFAVVSLEDSSSNHLSFKCTPEQFTELTQIDGVIPAPYLARHHWVSIQRHDAIRMNELQELIKNSYDLVFAKLPAKVKKRLTE